MAQYTQRFNKMDAYARKVNLALNNQLSEVLSEYSDSEINSSINDILSQGKKYRPLIASASCQAVGGNFKDSIKLGLAIELIHNATLIHDDIVDDDNIRRNNEAFHKKFGREKAILYGDLMISIAINLVSDYGKDVTKIFSEYGFQLCVGELNEITLSDYTNEDSYINIIKQKSGSLFKASTHLGALIGKGPEYEIKSLSDFGEYLGIAYQIRDDIRDFTNECFKASIKRRITLPLIHLYEVSDENTRKFIRENTHTLDLDKNSIQYCENKIREFIERSRASISNIKESDYKGYLLDISEILPM